MKSDKIVNTKLNQALKLLLTGINQYFLHSRMCENWGLDQLKSKNYEYSIELMKESDDVIKRILFLEGLANLQDLGKLYIGEDVQESLSGNMEFEVELRNVLVDGIAVCESVSDFISRDCLTKILQECEEQIDWLESQDYLIEKAGLQNYLQSMM